MLQAVNKRSRDPCRSIQGCAGIQEYNKDIFGISAVPESERRENLLPTRVRSLLNYRRPSDVLSKSLSQWALALTTC